jgi:hypothetical protein
MHVELSTFCVYCRAENTNVQKSFEIEGIGGQNYYILMLSETLHLLLFSKRLDNTC